MVRLSGETAAKQDGRRRRDRDDRGHPESGAGDYAIVQHALNEGELFRSAAGTHLSAFVEVDGNLWKAVVKAADGGQRIYLQTLHRARPNDLRAARRTLKRIDRE